MPVKASTTAQAPRLDWYAINIAGVFLETFLTDVT
jgi:hypothetical protein